MEGNEFLSRISHFISIRDWNNIFQTCVELQIWLSTNPKDSPRWDWNGFISKEQFKIFLSECPRCGWQARIISMGLFGCNAVCSNCSPDIVGSGNSIEESIVDWISKIKVLLNSESIENSEEDDNDL